MEEENGSGDELDLDQVEEEMAAQYGSDEDDDDGQHDVFNINVQSITPHANQMRAEVLESKADAEAWRSEVERVIPRLKLALKKPDSMRDWRSRLDLLFKYGAGVSSTMNSSQALLQKMSTDIEKSMERVETREKYLNTQLNNLLGQYSKTQEQLKQVEDKYSKSSGTVLGFLSFHLELK